MFQHTSQYVFKAAVTSRLALPPAYCEIKTHIILRKVLGSPEGFNNVANDLDQVSSRKVCLRQPLEAVGEAVGEAEASIRDLKGR